MTIRPIYLISFTPPNDPGIIHLPMLATNWRHPTIDLTRYDGIILTSKNGIEALERIDPAWKSVPVLCVGKATQRRAEELGCKVLAVSDGYGNGFYDIVRTRYADKRWLYARPKVVASDFAQRLRDDGIAVEEAVVYETRCEAKKVTEKIAENAVLIFTSPSAVACFQSWFDFHPAQGIVVIGHTTGKSVPDRPVHVAQEPTVASCISLAKQLAKEP
ncbi:MAG: uroporphyrinogen-III synthase [Campylobacterales bacterium]